MEITLNSTASAAVGTAHGAPAPLAGPAQDFSVRLAQAVDAVQQSVAHLRAQIRQGQGASAGSPAPIAQDSVDSLALLLGQFQQALQVGASTNASAKTEMISSTASVSASGQQAAGSEAAQLASPQESTTELWVRAALNQAIGRCVANGYDPGGNYTVNTLRGYFSGDAQARSNAIRAVDRAMLEAGGAYETFDGEGHEIAGQPPAGLDTSMPIFSGAYDKDWNRPSLYDMINSQLGWVDAEGQGRNAVNYADPANRDAQLNRKLSDEEVQAFQSGKLTPQLQALVNKYRQAWV